MNKPKVVVLSGAGMSAESGLKTFRDADGLWEGHDVMEVASLEGFKKKPELVLEFYNQRRRQLHHVKPNIGHLALRELEKKFEVTIITQNIDHLHEAAGSTQVIHLHGELFKARSTVNDNDIREWTKDLILGDCDANGYQLRPHIVWFGESVPLLEVASEVTAQADILIIIGTSMQVYPAASLIHYAKPDSPIYFIDPKPAINESFVPNLKIISTTATIGVPRVVKELMKMA